MEGRAMRKTKVEIEVEETEAMYLREGLANGSSDDYTVEWARIIPMGLHCTLTKKQGGKKISVIISERTLFDLMSATAETWINEDVQPVPEDQAEYVEAAAKKVDK